VRLSDLPERQLSVSAAAESTAGQARLRF